MPCGKRARREPCERSTQECLPKSNCRTYRTHPGIRDTELRISAKTYPLRNGGGLGVRRDDDQSLLSEARRNPVERRLLPDLRGAVDVLNRDPGGGAGRQQLRERHRQSLSADHDVRKGLIRGGPK